MHEQRVAVELLLGLLAGAAVIVGARLGDRLVDPYSEPRLTLSAWASRLQGGDTE